MSYLWIYNCLCKYCNANSTSLSIIAQASSGSPSWKYRSSTSRQEPKLINGETTYNSLPCTKEVKYDRILGCCSSFLVKISCWKFNKFSYLYNRQVFVLVLKISKVKLKSNKLPVSNWLSLYFCPQSISWWPHFGCSVYIKQNKRQPLPHNTLLLLKSIDIHLYRECTSQGTKEKCI